MPWGTKISNIRIHMPIYYFGRREGGRRESVGYSKVQQMRKLWRTSGGEIKKKMVGLERRWAG